MARSFQQCQAREFALFALELGCGVTKETARTGSVYVTLSHEDWNGYDIKFRFSTHIDPDDISGSAYSVSPGTGSLAGAKTLLAVRLKVRQVHS